MLLLISLFEFSFISFSRRCKNGFAEFDRPAEFSVGTKKKFAPT